MKKNRHFLTKDDIAVIFIECLFGEIDDNKIADVFKGVTGATITPLNPTLTQVAAVWESDMPLEDLRSRPFAPSKRWLKHIVAEVGRRAGE